MFCNLRVSNVLVILAPPALSLATSWQTQSHRRVLRSTDNIGKTVRQLNANGERAHLTLFPDIDERYTSFGTADFLELDVVQSSNAVTFDTVFVDLDGTESPVGNNTLYTLLISDTSTAKGAETFAVLSIDEFDNVRGIVEPKGRKPYTIRQSYAANDGNIMAVEDGNHDAPEWSCGLHDHQDIFDRRLDEEPHEHNVSQFIPLLIAALEVHATVLTNIYSQQQQHQNHKEHHHHDNNEHTPSSTMEHLSKSLRGSKMNQLNKRRLESKSDVMYQVNMYIEIDQAFVNNSGGNMVTAINYVNALVTAANVVYEKEILTHLHVSYIALTDLYKNSTNPTEALMLMVSRILHITLQIILCSHALNYPNMNQQQSTHGQDGSWHHSDINLHHGLFGAEWYGGLAWIGVLCRSDYGFGVTSSIAGSFDELDYTMVWDIYGFMHELGHQLGSGHTHDEKYYSVSAFVCITMTNVYVLFYLTTIFLLQSLQPVIDTCQTTCPKATDGSIPIGWSTIMSNCKRCDGSWNNIMYSFGGYYIGNGDISDITNWSDNSDLVANYDEFHFNNDPRREAHKMFTHVSTRGSCVDIPAKQSNDQTTETTAPTTQSPSTAPTTQNASSSTITTTKPTTRTTRISKAAKLVKIGRNMPL